MQQEGDSVYWFTAPGFTYASIIHKPAIRFVPRSTATRARAFVKYE